MIGRVCGIIRMGPPVIGDVGLLSASGATVPTDATAGYQTGCVFQHTDGGAGTAFYVNEGSNTSCAFAAVAGLTAAQEALLGATAGTVSASKAVIVDASKNISGFASVTIAGAATGVDHPIDLNSITAMTGDETVDCGNLIKINRSAGAIGGTHSGIICKNYITGGAVDGTGLVSGLYVNLKYEPTSENAAAEVSLMQTHLYSDASDAIDYGWYCLAPNSKIDSLIGISGTMTNFIEFKSATSGGLTVGSDGMTKNPENDTEDAFLTVKIEGGASYQIPLYTA